MNCTDCNKLRGQMKRLEAQRLGLRLTPEEAIRFYCRARVRIRAQMLRCYAAWLLAPQHSGVKLPPKPASSRRGKPAGKPRSDPRPKASSTIPDRSTATGHQADAVR